MVCFLKFISCAGLNLTCADTNINAGDTARYSCTKDAALLSFVFFFYCDCFGRLLFCACVRCVGTQKSVRTQTAGLTYERKEEIPAFYFTYGD